MAEFEYHQNLIEMSHYIPELHGGIFGAKVRLNLYKEKNTENLPEKIEMFPLLEQLKHQNDAYNANTEKKYDKLEDITLKEYEKFETIINKIDENEKIDEDMIIKQNIALTKNEIKQYLTDIDTIEKIMCEWLRSIVHQRDPYEARLEKARKGC